MMTSFYALGYHEEGPRNSAGIIIERRCPSKVFPNTIMIETSNSLNKFSLGSSPRIWNDGN